MSTTVDILTKRMDNVLKVPIQAVTVRSKKEIEGKEKKNSKATSEDEKQNEKDLQEVVFVYKDGKALIKPVKLGISDDTHYAVLEGLEEGDMVITGPFRVLTKTLKNGQTVRIKKEGKKDWC